MMCELELNILEGGVEEKKRLRGPRKYAMGFMISVN
jgi:hypothetical protein